MIKKSKEERELEKEVGELEKKKEKLEVKSRKLKEAQYKRRLKATLMKSLGITVESLEAHNLPHEYNVGHKIVVEAFLDQVVEIIFVAFPDFNHDPYFKEEPFTFRNDFKGIIYAVFGKKGLGSTMLERLDELEKKSSELHKTFADQCSQGLGAKDDLELSREDLQTLQLSQDELIRIIFVVLIQAAAQKVFPEKIYEVPPTFGGH